MYSSKSLFCKSLLLVMACLWVASGLWAAPMPSGISIDLSSFVGATKPSMETVLKKGVRVFYKKFTYNDRRKTKVFNFFIKSQGSFVAEVISSHKCSPQVHVPGKGWHKLDYLKGTIKARLLCHTDGSKGSAYSIRLKTPAAHSIRGEVKVTFLRAAGWKDNRSLEARVKSLENQNGALKSQVDAMLRSIRRLKARVNALDHKDDRKAKACPFYYLLSKDGKLFRKEGEILRNIVGAEQEVLEETDIDYPVIKDGQLSVLVKEEKDEISFIDYLALQVNGMTILPSQKGRAGHLLSTRDNEYLVMRKGDALLVTFPIPKGEKLEKVTLLAEGYYR